MRRLSCASVRYPSDNARTHSYAKVPIKQVRKEYEKCGTCCTYQADREPHDNHEATLPRVVTVRKHVEKQTKKIQAMLVSSERIEAKQQVE
jgi:hypothetical protein